MQPAAQAETASTPPASASAGAESLFALLLKDDLTSEEKQLIVEQTLAFYEQNLNPGYLEFKKSSDAKAVEWTGSGAWMTDLDGHSFIDCLGGYGVFALGHRPPEVIAAVEKSLTRIGLTGQELLNPFQAALAHRLAEISPGDLAYSYFHGGGAESNEAAFKIARLATGRVKHITMSNSFHGKTMGALAATNRDVIRQPFEPLVPGFIEVPFDDLDALEHAMSEEIASVIVEPVQGEGGINVPSDDFLPGVRALCDRYGALMHIDEVQTGMGRTGRWFGCDHCGVAPDLMTLGKALGGGVMPISAVHGNWRAWERLTENPWYVTNTFGGGAPACAASLATIGILERDRIIEQVPAKGELMLSLLSQIAERHPQHIKEVRGLGLLIGVEFHQRETGVAVAKKLFEHGVLVAHTINNPRVIRIEPPLVISEEEIRQVASRLAAVMGEVEAGK